MDEKTLADLEYPSILQRVRDETVSPAGASLAEALLPSIDRSVVEHEIALTVEAVDHLKRRGGLPFGTIPDVAPPLRRLTLQGSTLAPLEILDLLSLMKAGRSVKVSLTEVRTTYHRMWQIASEIPELGNLVRFLDGKIGGTGEVLDHASDDLKDLRRAIQGRTERLQSTLESIVRRPELTHALQDDFVSLRSDRHVIPLRAEARSALPGIVHGVSGSGATVFLEPLETVDLNNEIVTLRDQESVEVQRLLQEYTDLLRGRLSDLHALTHAMSRLDLIIAKARVARGMRAVPPELSATEAIVLDSARHPLVEVSLRSRGGTITPLDLTLSEGTRVLMISGPNTGGKTVALKTVGLLSLMCQSGLLVPAERAVLPVFRTLFIDIGDRQSITDQLSTFSARMKTIAAMARGLAPPALVLLDEVGTGTDPEEGVALGIAIVEYFRKRGATTLATTHLEALKAYAATGDRCANAAMQFDEATFTPTYRMVQGIPGRSGALEIAERLGLPGEIMETARRQRGSSGQAISSYLGHLQNLSSELESKLQAISEQQVQMEKDRASQEEALNEREARLRKALSDEIELALRSIRDEGERYLASLKDREAAHRLRRDEAKLASSLRAEARRVIRRVAGGASSGPTIGRELVPGQTVLVRGMGLRGNVHSIQSNKVTVLVRGKRLQVPREDCLIQEDASGTPSLRLPPGVALSRRGGDATTQIDLRGCTVAEALGQVDKFLDDAYLSGLAQLRIIHGVGSGRLKEALAEFLSGHLHVERFEGAPSESGGAGVTIVTLRP